jgi:hypothetical protein
VILIVVAAALLLAACAACRLLPLVWPDRAYRAEMARRDKAAADFLNPTETD